MRIKALARAGALLCAAVLAVGCSASAAQRPGERGPSSVVGGPRVSISPGDGSASVPPDSRIVVKTDDGTLTRVTARSRGQDVPGDLNTGRTSWQARWTLTPGAAYQVTATAITRSGAAATATSTFRAAVVHGGLTAWVAPSEGATVGVGMPVTVTFNHPVTDQAAVERTLQIHSDKPVTGAWHWTDQATVMFRTQNGHYWPADQNITVTAHLAGVRRAQELTAPPIPAVPSTSATNTSSP